MANAVLTLRACTPVLIRLKALALDSNDAELQHEGTRAMYKVISDALLQWTTTLLISRETYGKLKLTAMRHTILA